MSKRPSLAGLARPKPIAGAPAAPPARTSDAPRAPARANAAPSAGGMGTAEDDMHSMTVRISKATSKALKIRAIDEERSVVDLIRDAIDTYLSQHRG